MVEEKQNEKFVGMIFFPPLCVYAGGEKGR